VCKHADGEGPSQAGTRNPSGPSGEGDAPGRHIYDRWRQQLDRSLLKVLYLVDPARENQRLAGKRVTVIDHPDGRIRTKHGSGPTTAGADHFVPAGEAIAATP
jgi:hypothetical protein